MVHERPLQLLVGIDSNNETFPFAWAFLPSEAKWVFKWVIEGAIPHMLRPESLARVKVVMTDQDGQLVTAVERNVGLGKVFPGAVHRCCAWHKLDRNLTNKPN